MVDGFGLLFEKNEVIFFNILQVCVLDEIINVYLYINFEGLKSVFIFFIFFELI